MIKKDGWQFWVEIGGDTVIKISKTENEIREKIKKHLDKMGKSEELEKRTKNMLDDVKEATRILKESNIPEKFLANLEFLENGKIKQSTAKVLEEVINESENPKELVERAVEFLITLWKYGIHEKTFKFISNMGILDGEFALLDAFEITDKKEKVEKQLLKKGWENINRFEGRISKEMTKHFLEKCGELLTVDNLNQNWGILK